MREKRTSRDVREAAATACEALIFRSGLDRNKPAEAFILTRTLNELVWCHSGTHEDTDKHLGCPWWTERAFQLLETDKNWRKGVELEHVVERKTTIAALLECRSGDDVREILRRSETCVVLREEHKALPKGDGWARYADIRLVPGPKVRKRLGTDWPPPPNAN